MIHARLVPIGAVAGAALRWTGPRGAYLTVIATATLVLDRQGGASLDPRPEPPDPIEVAPYLPRGEITLRAAEREPGSGSMRLAVWRADAPLVDKRLPSRRGSIGAFGPVAPSGPQRLAMLRPGDAEAWGAPDRMLREGFPLQYFQTAPADQQIAGHFTGAETLVLEGLVRGAERVQWRLPSIRVEARRVVEGDDGGIVLPMHLDTIRIDGEASRVSLVWRGYQSVGTDRPGDVPVFAVGVALGEAAIAWPVQAREGAAPSGSSSSAPGRTLSPVVVERLAQPVAPFAMKAPGPDKRRTPSPPGGAAVPWSAAAKSARVEPARAGQHATLQHMSAMPDLVAAAAATPRAVAPPEPRVPESPRVVLRAPAEVEVGGQIRLSPGLGSELLVAFAEAVLASRPEVTGALR